ncbi:hypothetical protein ACIBI9_30405 [Nonomuraea sp. NPDC050451]|uniref:hypothetical protein n=1 Tax=Nonomuraea sp. NPDC050451 TaxID=3364364 RepID=UPI00379998F0
MALTPHRPRHAILEPHHQGDPSWPPPSASPTPKTAASSTTPATTVCPRISGLNQDDNTFVTLTPANDSASWYASVSLLPDGDYEVELANPDQQEHQTTLHTDHSKVVRHVNDRLARLQRAR